MPGFAVHSDISHHVITYSVLVMALTHNLARVETTVQCRHSIEILATASNSPVQCPQRSSQLSTVEFHKLIERFVSFRSVSLRFVSFCFVSFRFVLFCCILFWFSF